ncbi:MAG TPA: FecR domain-containing protein [Polyangiales bacterium]|nr:FecR domain-containing protein [Polyangiales bacterium]
MNPSRPRLAQAVLPEVTEGRVARQWATIERRLPRRGAHSSVWFGLLMTVPLLAAGALWLSQRNLTAPTTGSVIESASTPVNITLRDGSTLALDAQTRLRLLRDEAHVVDVELGSGKANFDVTHVQNRSFRVHAGSVLVKVLGTRFEVAKTPRKEGTHVQVAVTRGVVEVQRLDATGGVRRLSAGETWSALVPAKPTVDAEAAAASSSAAVVDPPQPVQAAEPPAPAPPPALPDTFSPETSPPSRAAERAQTREERRIARARAAAQARERAVNSAALFKRASLARRTGQTHEAADLYVELLRRFPNDSRAGIAAFELGRIRMDALAQPKAAVDAFVTALQTSPRASFREDALARIVVANDQLGAREACQAARDRYLRDFPSGVHALALAARCSTPAR